MRLDDHGSKQEHRDSVQDLAYQRRSTIPATSEKLHTHRKVPLLVPSDRRFGMTIKFWKEGVGPNREIHRLSCDARHRHHGWFARTSFPWRKPTTFTS